MSSAGDESASLQSRLEVDGHDRPDDAGAAHASGGPTIEDPVALLRHLHVSGRFHRDSGLGRLFHRGQVSLRENVPTSSLHVSIDGNRVSAHVDGVSPLAVETSGPTRYSARRAVAHNLGGIAQDVVWLLRGRQGDHRCALSCEWVSSEARGAPARTPLLDPTAAAWSVHLEARVAGRLDEARLRAALAAVLGHHGRGRDHLDVVDCHDDDELDAARTQLQCMPVAVTDRPPLHVFLAHHPAGDVLLLNVNHAAADGAGALWVLHRIARAYAAAGAEPSAPLEFLAGLDLPVRPASPPMSLVQRSGKVAVEWLRDKLARTGRLAADQATDRPGYGFHLVALSAEETARLVDRERTPAGHNVLMAALHLAIGRWNLQHGHPGRRIGVLVPADLRPPEWREDAIGNFSVTARLSTNRRERSGPATALRAITAQTSRNNRTRTGIALIAGLQRVGMLGLWAKQSVVVLAPLSGNRRVDTAMLSDLGRLDEAPWFGPEAGETRELWFSTPARSPLSLCIGAVTIGERLHLTYRYPHRLFGPDAARRFAECHLDHVRSVSVRGG